MYNVHRLFSFIFWGGKANKILIEEVIAKILNYTLKCIARDALGMQFSNEKHGDCDQY